jgi:hypothetical protein
MRVLLDECVPKRLRTELPGHEVQTVADEGWSGLSNGKLLAQAALTFDCFLTVDRNLQFQQNPNTLPIAVVVIIEVDNKFETLQRRMGAVREVLASIKVGECMTVRV